MAGDDIIYPTVGKMTYTFDEAIEYMKIKDKQATRINETLNWVDAKTGKKVIIGYTY